MIVAIHQPNYIPWQGYFYKMLNCDIFVFLDNVQFSKNSIINRNKIKTNSGETWLTVPVLTKNSHQQLIRDVRINRTVDWRRKHKNSIQQYYIKAPFFKKYAPHLLDLYSKDWERLVELNTALIKFVTDCLDIKKEFINASTLGLSGKSTDLLIEVCKKLNGDVYLSGEGSKKYMDEEKFKEAGIKIKYTDFKQTKYSQLYGDFIPNLSILDLFFNCGRESRKILEGMQKNEQ